MTLSHDPQPVPALLGQRHYERKSPSRPIDLRLDANEGGTFAAEVLGQDWMQAESLRRYPDARELEAMLASRLEVEPQRVLVTAGADDALARICQAFLESGRRAVYCTPTFEMLRRYIRLSGATPREIPWPSGTLPVDAMIESGRDAEVVFVVSPNNPTGTVATATDLARLRDALPGTLLVIDAAYAEFADDDLTALGLSMRATVVVRSFSKAWSAAGLRVGYAAAEQRIIDCLRAVGQPYAVSGVSLAAAKLLLERGEAKMRAFVAQEKTERRALIDLLRNLGAEPVEGHANFVLARFRDAATVADSLEQAGIAVRRFPNEDGLGNALRIGCPGDSASFERLVRGLRAACTRRASANSETRS